MSIERLAQQKQFQDQNHPEICTVLSGLKIRDICLLILKFNPLVPGVH